MLEYILIAIFSLLAGTLYGSYRYFNDLIEEYHSCIMKEVNQLKMYYSDKDGIYIRGCKDRFDLFEKRLKEGLQSNNICSQSAIDKLRTDIRLLNERLSKFDSIAYKPRKKTEGSVTVVSEKQKGK